MVVLIIGGKLQGTEAVYLARKAGYKTWLVDKNVMAPASKLCDKFFNVDALERQTMLQLYRNADLVIPAMENKEVLDALGRYSAETGTPLVFDAQAYELSSSKQRSDRFFLENDIPAPRPYPDCAYPIIVKPSRRSGSEGVAKLYSKEELEANPDYLNGDYVIQEYLEGRSFSIEVVGCGTSYNILQVTEILVDSCYDCKQVVAPAMITEETEASFYQIAVNLAETLKINGIFDIEVILDNGRLKVLEIDARLPSQTPVSVYHSTGINMVELMADAAFGQVRSVSVRAQQVCLLQQVAVTPGSVELLGEKIMAGVGPLGMIKGFFGADEALTNYSTEKERWAATLIITEKTEPRARARLAEVIENIRKNSREGRLQQEAIG
ncbi:3-methylornithine--L-lysine ligase PylC [Eubacterium limosum]|uniref:3-methylornithine--L-lysine ligase PylC n=1 Tax=Eubacterium limosum TaxID=1736 RepID=UPI001063D0C3|nr:3-methylornithine--L-lysine ligase PylC [Eubacterium limosum]